MVHLRGEYQLRKMEWSIPKAEWSIFKKNGRFPRWNGRFPKMIGLFSLAMIVSKRHAFPMPIFRQTIRHSLRLKYSKRHHVDFRPRHKLHRMGLFIKEGDKFLGIESSNLQSTLKDKSFWYFQAGRFSWSSSVLLPYHLL